MLRQITAALGLGLVLALAASPAAASPEPAPLTGGILLTEGGRVSLYEPSSGALRQVADRGSEPVFFPNGRAFAYIRAGGCSSNGNGGCFTQYSVFAKSFSDPAEAPGRRIFGRTRFFVRSIDIARGGRLVFAAKRGPGPAANGTTMEIYSSALDGTHVRRLTRNRAFENDVAVSPNGRLIAFSRRIHGRGQIFVMRIDGTHVRRLTRDRRRNRLPAWAPNGRRIAFLSQAAGQGQFTHRQIHSISLRGTGRRPLTYGDPPKGGPTYSPGGNYIAFVIQGNVWKIGAGGALPQQILAGPEPVGYEGDLDWGPLAAE